VCTSLTFLIVDLEVKFATRGQLTSWLSWENDSVLAGTPPPSNEDDGYKVPITVTASYSAFGMSHVIESRLELEIISPGSGAAELASSLRSVSNAHSAGGGNTMDPGLEAYLDDDDDDMMFMSGGNPFSSENNTPPSAITPSIANPNQLLYVPSQSLQNSLQNSPLKQSPMGPTPSPSGPSLPNSAINPLTPTMSPASLQFSQHVVGSTPRQPSSAPQTPIGGPPSQLSLQIPSQSHENTGPPNQPGPFRYSHDPQSSMMYSLQNHMRLSPPASAESSSGNRMYGIDEEASDNTPLEHGYFDDTYPVELGSPFLER
jgi:hypothetical protein